MPEIRVCLRFRRQSWINVAGLIYPVAIDGHRLYFLLLMSSVFYHKSLKYNYVKKDFVLVAILIFT